MTILPSRHRCISIVDFGPDGWEVPEDENDDRFRLPTSDTSSNASLVGASAASSPLTAVWSVERTASSDIASWSAVPSTIRSTYSQPQEGSVSDGSLSSNPWSTAAASSLDVDHHPSYAFPLCSIGAFAASDPTVWSGPSLPPRWENIVPAAPVPCMRICQSEGTASARRARDGANQPRRPRSAPELGGSQLDGDGGNQPFGAAPPPKATRIL